uniref:Uncharacterized protein n=1 Tax=Meloidogyne javanica TaxID=6303 RepID=A0A915LTN3_MELJA
MSQSGQRVPVDCRILHVLKEPFLVNQSCILQQQQNIEQNNLIIELISKTSPNHLNVLEARNIAFAGFKCLNGEAFCIVLRTREETIHSNSLLGGNQPFLSDIWMASEKNNRHISTKTFPKYLDNQTIKFIKMGVSAILKNLPLENNGINSSDYNQLKPEYSALLKELQSFGHKVTFVGDVQNSISESQAIKQANLSIGIINYSNKLNNYSFNSFDVLIKCLEDGSGLVKLIVGIKEFGIGMKINLIRSLSLTLSQAPALLLPFLLSPLSDIPPIILPIHIVLVAFLFQLQYCIGFAFTPFD